MVKPSMLRSDMTPPSSASAGNRMPPSCRSAFRWRGGRAVGGTFHGALQVRALTGVVPAVLRLQKQRLVLRHQAEPGATFRAEVLLVSVQNSAVLSPPPGPDLADDQRDVLQRRPRADGGHAWISPRRFHQSHCKDRTHPGLSRSSREPAAASSYRQSRSTETAAEGGRRHGEPCCQNRRPRGARTKAPEAEERFQTRGGTCSSAEKQEPKKAFLILQNPPSTAVSGPGSSAGLNLRLLQI